MTARKPRLARRPVRTLARAAAKTAAATMLDWTGLLERQAARATQGGEPFIVCYHRVVDRLHAGAPRALPAMETSVATFERHLDWLGRRFRVVSLDEVADELAGAGRRSARPTAAVTLDDGYRDVYEHAFPVLRRMGIPAGVFVVTDLVGTHRLPPHERLHAGLAAALAEVPRSGRAATAALGGLLREAGVRVPPGAPVPRDSRDPFVVTRFLLEHLSCDEVQAIIARLDAAQTAASASEGLQPLSWEMLDAMLAAGLTVGSHTRTHARLAHESEERIRAELVGSRRALEQRLRVPARHFAYPGGDFNGAVVRAVAAAGYATAFTICRHRDPGHPRLTIPRVTLWEASCSGPFGGFSEALLRAHVAGLLPAAGGCRHEGVAPGAAPAVIGPASRRSAAGRPAQQREAASCAASPEY